MLSFFGRGRANSEVPGARAFAECPETDDRCSDFADGGACSSKSLCTSQCTSQDISAFTAPPRYRNSGCFVHGTKYRHFNSIMEHGLKAVKSAIFMIDEVRADGRVPGLQDPPEILIFIDESKARSHMMEFDYDAAHGTWKTKGIGGIIRPWFFQKVVDQRRKTFGNVLFQSKEDPVMLANVMKGTYRPKQLIHATYWENVFGILQEGIVPAKNPTAEFRKPFKELLQGAEAHVYALAKYDTSRASDPEISVEPDTCTSAKDPEIVPADEEDAPEYTLRTEALGLERPPDAFFVIDADRADEMGIDLELVQSADRNQTVYIHGPVAKEILVGVEPNDPVDLPAELKAKIVDPKSFDEIPIIDMSADDDTVISQLRHACEVVGFMQVVGHGISPELLHRHASFHRQFFALPQDVKSSLALCEANPVRGYFGKGGEDLDQVLADKVDTSGGEKISNQKRSDNKEALDCNGVPWAKPVGGYVANIFGLPSQLPEDQLLDGFGEVLDAYSAEMFRLSRRLLGFMARILDLPADFFEDHLTQPVATHRLLHYWPISDFKKQIGVGEHSDYGLLTILKQDSVGGLQVLNARDGRWVHCCPIEGAFVVNLGDMLARWTGHRFKSTIHRVVNTSPLERYSVPYFLEPNMDSVIIPGDLCRQSAQGLRTDQSEHQRRCQLRARWRQVRDSKEVATSEEILERFYRASGQLKYKA